MAERLKSSCSELIFLAYFEEIWFEVPLLMLMCSSPQWRCHHEMNTQVSCFFLSSANPSLCYRMNLHWILWEQMYIPSSCFQINNAYNTRLWSPESPSLKLSLRSCVFWWKIFEQSKSTRFPGRSSPSMTRDAFSISHWIDKRLIWWLWGMRSLLVPGWIFTFPRVDEPSYSHTFLLDAI